MLLSGRSNTLQYYIPSALRAGCLCMPLTVFPAYTAQTAKKKKKYRSGSAFPGKAGPGYLFQGPDISFIDQSGTYDIDTKRASIPGEGTRGPHLPGLKAPCIWSVICKPGNTSKNGFMYYNFPCSFASAASSA